MNIDSLFPSDFENLESVAALGLFESLPEPWEYRRLAAARGHRETALLRQRSQAALPPNQPFHRQQSQEDF